ncbi:MAG TPA: SPOR domain-containing protein [Gammaproteobacteria bacterium]|nr:SPOR domain-containing protein [Gammaproteobacteria bacterium]
MLRISFFILLLANLILALWYTQIAPRPERAQIPAVPEEKRLVLLQEHQGQAAAAPRQPGQEPPPQLLDVQPAQEQPRDPAPVEVPAISCHTIGPFPDLDRAKAVSERIHRLGAKVTRRNKTEQEQYGYRVFLPPYKTREAALAATQQLAKNGIQDYFVISDDEHKNGISLGLFRKKSGAERRMAQVSRFGFKPQMEIRNRESTIYWLDYEQTGELVTDSIWREITEETPNLQQLPRDCGAKTM